MKSIRLIYKQLIARWKAEMPIAFRAIVYAGTTVSGLALAVNTAMEMGHAIQPAWWLYCYPYLLMIPAAVAFFAKFTKKGDKNNDK
jgi:hypothetical protein